MDQNLRLPTSRIDVLDGWRAISVTLVVLSHLIGISGLRVYFGESFRGLALNYGQIGVEFFFAISGFVICSGMLREERVDIAGFYIRRVFRILPPLILYVAVVGALAVGNIVQVDGSSFARALSFTCNFGECSWALGHTWSLAYEEQFYLAFPLIFIVLGRHRRRGLLAIGIALVAALLLLYWFRSAGVAPLRHFFSITCGVIAALFAGKLFEILRRVPWPILIVAGLIPFLIQLGPWSSRLIWFGYLVCIGPAVTIAMLGSVVNPHMQFLAWPPLTVVGRASYGIYLWQQLATADFGTSSLLVYAGAVITSGLWVWLLYSKFEKPLISLGRDLSRRGRSERKAISAV